MLRRWLKSAQSRGASGGRPNAGGVTCIGRGGAATAIRSMTPFRAGPQKWMLRCGLVRSRVTINGFTEKRRAVSPTSQRGSVKATGRRRSLSPPAAAAGDRGTMDASRFVVPGRGPRDSRLHGCARRARASGHLARGRAASGPNARSRADAGMRLAPGGPRSLKRGIKMIPLFSVLSSVC